MKTAEQIWSDIDKYSTSQIDADDTQVIYAAMQECAGQYKTLLSKYIHHVRDCEGVDFITTGHATHSVVDFTEEEMKILESLAADPSIG
jgi:major membrane immunogen (membrane-anchored lipoprotein)